MQFLAGWDEFNVIREQRQPMDEEMYARYLRWVRKTFHSREKDLRNTCIFLVIGALYLFLHLSQFAWKQIPSLIGEATQATITEVHYDREDDIYEYRYQYLIDGNDYTGTGRRISEMHVGDIIEVYYVENNPRFSVVPLDRSKQLFFLLFPIAFAILATGVIALVIRSLRKEKQNNLVIRRIFRTLAGGNASFPVIDLVRQIEEAGFGKSTIGGLSTEFAGHPYEVDFLSLETGGFSTTENLQGWFHIETRQEMIDLVDQIYQDALGPVEPFAVHEIDTVTIPSGKKSTMCEWGTVSVMVPVLLEDSTIPATLKVDFSGVDFREAVTKAKALLDDPADSGLAFFSKSEEKQLEELRAIDERRDALGIPRLPFVVTFGDETQNAPGSFADFLPVQIAWILYHFNLCPWHWDPVIKEQRFVFPEGEEATVRLDFDPESHLILERVE